MKTFLIFDQTIDLKDLEKKLTAQKPDLIDFVCFTSDQDIIDKIKEICQIQNIAINFLNSSKLIEDTTDQFRNKIVKWSAELGRKTIKSKSLIDWLAVENESISTWWFTNLSEKSPLKTDAFLKIIQLEVINQQLIKNNYNLCLNSIQDKTLTKAIIKLCQRLQITVGTIRTLHTDKASLKNKLYDCIKKEKTFNSIIKAKLTYTNRYFRSWKCKIKLGSLKQRLKQVNESILFISYFPAVDKQSAKQGILENKYCLPLQEKFKQMNKKICWLWLYIKLDNNSYSQALKYSNNFTQNKTNNFFLEEFFTLRIFIRIILLWLKQIKTYITIRKHLTTEFYTENFTIPEAGIFIKNLANTSLIGWTALEGIMYHQLFKNAFKSLSKHTHCIYYSEMQAWEKALCLAQKKIIPKTKTIGFQHTCTSLNYYYYFYHPSETSQNQGLNSLPLPDVYACNGELTYQALQKNNFPNLQKVEAVRYLYIKEILEKPDFSQKQNIVLLAGTIDKTETKALLSLFFNAFPESENFEIWLKSHPANPIAPILDELKLDLQKVSYKIINEPIEQILKKTKVMIVGDSAIALEALVFGVQVIIPTLNDRLFLTPLKGFEQFYKKTHSVEELKNSVTTLLTTDPEDDFEKNKTFINNYWQLDKSLVKWEQLLK